MIDQLEVYDKRSKEAAEEADRAYAAWQANPGNLFARGRYRDAQARFEAAERVYKAMTIRDLWKTNQLD